MMLISKPAFEKRRQAPPHSLVQEGPRLLMTFAHSAYALGQRERLINKSFLVLFLKKELLPFFFQPHFWSRSAMSRT
jgi:hypothetical protein